MEIVIAVIVILVVGGLIYRAKNKPKSDGIGGSGGSKTPKPPQQY